MIPVILESSLKKLLRRNAVLGVLEDLGRWLSLGSNAVALVLEGAVVHKDQAVPRKSEGLPDRTAAAVQPLKEEKARLFAVVEGCCRAREKGSLGHGMQA